MEKKASKPKLNKIARNRSVAKATNPSAQPSRGRDDKTGKENAAKANWTRSFKATFNL